VSGRFSGVGTVSCTVLVLLARVEDPRDEDGERQQDAGDQDDQAHRHAEQRHGDADGEQDRLGAGPRDVDLFAGGRDGSVERAHQRL
jgi:hypothetical protein